MIKKVWLLISMIRTTLAIILAGFIITWVTSLIHIQNPIQGEMQGKYTIAALLTIAVLTFIHGLL